MVKVERMKQKLDTLLSSQDKYLKKAQKLGMVIDKLRKDILFEENNAIASKVREMGLSPNDFDIFITQYMKQNPKVVQIEEKEDSVNETAE